MPRLDSSKATCRPARCLGLRSRSSQPGAGTAVAGVEPDIVAGAADTVGTLVGAAAVECIAAVGTVVVDCIPDTAVANCNCHTGHKLD